MCWCILEAGGICTCSPIGGTPGTPPGTPPGTRSTLNPPTSLVGQTVPSGLHLSWQIPTDMPSTNFLSGYEVWARRPGTNTFTRITTLHGRANTAFLDYTFYEAGRVIDYKVRAFFYPTNGNTPIFSDFSNVVTLTTPNRPAPVLTFRVRQTALSQAMLDWTTDPSQAVSRVFLYRFIDGTDNNFRRVGTTNSNRFDFIDTGFPAGRRIRYRVQIESPNGNLSNPVQDFIHSTHRDPNRPSPVRITRVEHDGSIEPWWRGSPEFIVTVMNVSRDGRNTPIVVQSNIRLDFPARPLGIGNTRTANFNVTVLNNWRSDFFYDMLTFHVLESDRSRSWDWNLSAGFSERNPEEGTLTHNATATITVNSISRGTVVGRAYYNFYDPADNHWLQFPVGGVRIRLHQ